MQNLEDLLLKIQNRFGATVVAKISYAEITVELAASDLLKCAKILRDALEFQFDQLLDVCGIDYLSYGVSEWATDSATSEGFSRGVIRDDPRNDKVTQPARFATIYHLLSTTLKQRVRLKVFLPGDPPRVPSVIEIWQSANWYEREAFDLFGILFDDHPDLRRILTDYGFVGHPFRKDFPLIGEVEMRYDATEARVIYEPVSIKPRTLVPKVIRQIGLVPEEK